MTDQRKKFEIFEHTADAGLQVFGRDMVELFANAAAGIYFLMLDDSRVEKRLAREIRVSSPDREALLVEWLSELIFLTSARHELFSEFEIRELSDTALYAVVRGEQFDRARHNWHKEVKAVTYHGLKIEESEEGFKVRIIFDV